MLFWKIITLLMKNLDVVPSVGVRECLLVLELRVASRDDARSLQSKTAGYIDGVVKKFSGDPHRDHSVVIPKRITCPEHKEHVRP